MAAVDTGFRPERADWALSYLEQEWNNVPLYIHEFPSWDEMEQVSFVHEWDVRSSWLGQLHAWRAVGNLTTAQIERLEAVETLVTRHGAAIDRLRGIPTAAARAG